MRAVTRAQRPGFLPRLGHALAAGWHGLLDALLGLAVLWPLWLLLALALPGAWLLLRVRRRRA